MFLFDHRLPENGFVEEYMGYRVCWALYHGVAIVSIAFPLLVIACSLSSEMTQKRAKNLVCHRKDVCQQKGM